MMTLKYRLWLIGALVVISIMYVLPSVPPVAQRLPQWWQEYLPNDAVHLGLDLRGGMYLLLGVKTDKAVESTLQQTVSELKSELRRQKVKLTSINWEPGGKIVVNLEPTADKEKLEAMLSSYYSYDHSFSPSPEQLQLVLTMHQKEIIRIKDSAVTQGLETIRNRIDQFGVAEPSIQRYRKDQLLIQLPGIKDVERAKKLIGKTALLEFKLVDEEHSLENALKGDKPPGTEILYHRGTDKKTGRESKEPYLIEKRTLMTGDVLVNAQVNIDNEFGEPYVTLKFNKKGGKLFARITETNVKRKMAIILDKNVYSAPVIQEKISGGSAQITGHFSPEEARDLAIVLRAGALPAPVEIMEERTVGPSLGSDSIRQGFISILIGGLAVLLFMVSYYHLSGLVANLALVLNLLFLAAALAALKATLTLPGIAGIVLTIGMAVDANVLIYERIREELRLGKTVRAAIDSGYAKAFLTILDANITTLIAALVLFQFGTGPIKGFAVTLSLGILASMFTAIIVTRAIFDTVLQQRRITQLSI